MKIIVAHPLKQHSYQLATALNKGGNLCLYCTTVYDKPNSFMRIAKKFLKGDSLKKASNRKCDGFNDEQVKLFCELRGFLFLLLGRIKRYKKFKRVYQRYLCRSFGRKVAKYAIKNEVDAIIMFDTTATSCFEIIKKKKPSIKLILDMSAISQPYAKKIYEEEGSKNNTSYFRNTQEYLWNTRVMNYMNKELEYADYFLVASEFVKQSLIFCGVDENKVTTIPYGIDTTKFKPLDKKYNDTFKIVYVGHVDYQKGIHHLLNAFSYFENENIQLDLYGVYHENSELYKNGIKNKKITFHGFVTPDKLCSIYNDADVFMFPSTNDGYGFVVLEAMACGLPVLCSKNAGSCDLVQEGVNGFTFDTGDVNKIKELIQWCLEHRDSLKEMGKSARKIVENMTIEKYNNGIDEFVNNLE